MPVKDVTVDEQVQQIHARLFSNRMRMGFSEQLHKGLGRFSNSFDQVPVECYGL